MNYLLLSYVMGFSDLLPRMPLCTDTVCLIEMVYETESPFPGSFPMINSPLPQWTETYAPKAHTLIQTQQ